MAHSLPQNFHLFPLTSATLATHIIRIPVLVGCRPRAVRETMGSLRFCVYHWAWCSLTADMAVGTRVGKNKLRVKQW